MIDLEEALRVVLNNAQPLEPENVALASALGRVLRRDVVADLDSPPFDCSAMDGYAMRASDRNEPLRVIGEIQAGGDNALEIQPGTCARIFTGARVPVGADCVVMQEETSRDGSTVRVARASAAANIRRRGENCRRGDVVVPACRRLGASDVAAAAACGEVRPLVSRKPRVAHLVTGNELVDPGVTPSGTQIRDSNSILIQALLAGHGAELVAQQRIGDSLDESRQALEALPDFDVLLISGGASVGDFDFAAPLLEGAGFEIHMRKLNLRPGKPTIFATREDRFAFGLPGNPVAHWTVFYLLVAPLLRHLGGERAEQNILHGHFAETFRAKPSDRFTCWPAMATVRDGGHLLEPLPFVSSGDVMGLAGANALLRIPAGTGDIAPGQPVEFYQCPI